MLSLSAIKVQRPFTNKHPGSSSTNEHDAGPKNTQGCYFQLYQKHFIPCETPFISTPFAVYEPWQSLFQSPDDRIINLKAPFPIHAY